LKGTALGLALWTAACSSASDERDGRLTASVQYPPADSARFETPAWLRRCGGGRGFLLEGIARGNGVLVWLRPGSGDTVPAGSYPVLARGDTFAPRGAVVAVRFMAGDLARGLGLDSGAVVVTRAVTGGGVSAQLRGGGLETMGGRRAAVEASFTGTVLAADTVPCRVGP
jgi:hypothetical protein